MGLLAFVAGLNVGIALGAATAGAWRAVAVTAVGAAVATITLVVCS